MTDLKEMLRLASAASSIVSARTGALAVMSSHEEIEELLKENNCHKYSGKYLCGQSAETIDNIK